MSDSENLLLSFVKKPIVALTITALSGFGLGVLFQRNRSQLKIIDSSDKDKKPENTQYGNLPHQYQVTKEELIAIMKEYTKLLSDKKSLENMIPRVFQDEKDLMKLCDNLTYAKGDNDLHSLTKALSEPIWDLLDRGGKRWRPILGMFIAQAYGRSIDEIIEAASLVEIVHNGSLIIDDIEDQSQVRRDKPCIHLIYREDIAVNAGCFMYYAPMLGLIKAYEKKFSNEKMFRLMKIYTEEMVNIHLGQAWDIYWHNCDKILTLPNEAQYLQMTAHKTGVLARMGARLTCAIMDLPEEVQNKFAAFCEKIGVAFQIQDDILNLIGEEYVATKGYYGEDIFEGKMSLMVIHCLNNSNFEDKSRLLDILKMKTKEKALIDEAIHLLKKTNSITYAKIKAESLVAEAWNGIKDCIPNNKFKGCLKTLSEFFIVRKV